MFNRSYKPLNKSPDRFQNDTNLSTIQNLYPELTPEEQAEAEHALRRYLALVWRIYQRLRRENPEKFDETPFKR